MDRKTLLAGLIGVACGVILASIAWMFSTVEFGNVSKIDEPDVQILALELAYQEMLRNKPPMRQESQREIIMFTRDGCVWCDKWFAEQYEAFKRLGYKVAICNDHQFSPVPQFQVTNESGQKQYVGYLNANQFEGKK
jgi:hypothetical protein